MGLFYGFRLTGKRVHDMDSRCSGMLFNASVLFDTIRLVWFLFCVHSTSVKMEG